MNKITSHQFFPAVVTSFAAAVLSIVPFLQSFSCCLMVPAAAWIALAIDQRLTKYEIRITAGKAFAFGAITGVLTACFITGFDLFFTYLSRSNELIASLPQLEKTMSEMNLLDLARPSLDLLYRMRDEIAYNGFSWLYSFYIFLSQLVTNTIFAIIGALIGMAALNSQYHKKTKTGN